MSRQTKLKQNDNSSNNLSNNQNKQPQTSSVRPYQKLSQNQHSRFQSEAVQFESPPAFYEYSHKSQGVTPFVLNGQADKKFVQLNPKKGALQDLSNQQQKQPQKYSPRTAPSSPVKPILVNKGQSKRSVIQFNVLMNKLEEKEIHNEQDLSNVHFSISSNQDQDQCYSSRMCSNQEYKKSVHGNDINGGSKFSVDDSLLILREELKHPKVKPIRIPETIIKTNEQTKYNNERSVEPKDKRKNYYKYFFKFLINISINFINHNLQNFTSLSTLQGVRRKIDENKNLQNKFHYHKNVFYQKAFQITCDSQRGTKRTMGEYYDTQFDDATLIERYSDENRQIMRLDFQNKFQAPPSQQSRRENTVMQNRNTSLNDLSMTARNNISQLVQDYNQDDIQYKLNYSSRYIPGQKNQLSHERLKNKQPNQIENEAKKKFEQNTPKFNRNTTCDSGQGLKQNSLNRQVILPQTREFNQQNPADEHQTFNINLNQLQNYRSPEPKQSNPKQLTNEDIYTLQKQNKEYIITENFKTISDKLTPRDHIQSNQAQLTLEDLDEMRQFQIEAYNKFLSNTNQNSGSKKNIIDCARKQDFSTNTIVNNNFENKSQYLNTQNNLTNTSHISDRYAVEQKLQQPYSQPIISEVQTKNYVNINRYTDNDTSINQKLTNKYDYVNCSPAKTNQSNLQFIHERLARQKEVVLNNAYHHFSNNGNLKSKSARISPVREPTISSISPTYNDNTQQKLNSLNQQSNNIEVFTVYSPYSQNINVPPRSPSEIQIDQAKPPYYFQERTQTPNKEKKWEDLASSIGVESQNGFFKNIPHQSSAKQKIQSPQSSSKRDLLEKLLKKSPTSSIPLKNDEMQQIIQPLQDYQDEETKKSRNRQNSNQVSINEASPNSKIQQILYNKSKEIITPKSNVQLHKSNTLTNNLSASPNKNVSPKQNISSPKSYAPSPKQSIVKSKQQIPSPKYTRSPKAQIANQKNTGLNYIDDINNLSYRSPKNVEQKMQTKQAATALMLNDKVTKRQPSPINKDFQYQHIFSPNKPQNQYNKINQVQISPKLSPKSNLKQVYQQLDDTKIQNKIAMIKSQLQTLNKQNNSVLLQHENNISQPSISSINMIANNPQSRYLSRDNSQSTLPAYVNQYVKRDEPHLQQYASNNKLPSDILAQDLQIQNSYPNQIYNPNQINSTTTTVTTIHTYKKPSPQQSGIGINYSPFNSKYSDLEYYPNQNNPSNSNNLANLNQPITSNPPNFYNPLNSFNPPNSYNPLNNYQTNNYNEQNQYIQPTSSILPNSQNTQNPYNTHFSYNVPNSQYPTNNINDLSRYQSSSNRQNNSPQSYQNEQNYQSNLSTNNIEQNIQRTIIKEKDEMIKRSANQNQRISPRQINNQIKGSSPNTYNQTNKITEMNKLKFQQNFNQPNFSLNSPREDVIETTRVAMNAVNLVNQITSPTGFDVVRFDSKQDFQSPDASTGLDQFKVPGKDQFKNQPQRATNLYQNYTANNSPVRQNNNDYNKNISQDDINQNQYSERVLQDYFVARKNHIEKRIENKQDTSKERYRQKSSNQQPQNKSKTNILERRKQSLKEQYSKDNSSVSNMMNMTDANSFLLDVNQYGQQQFDIMNQQIKTPKSGSGRSVSPFGSKRNLNSKSNLNLNDVSSISIYSQKTSPMSTTPRNTSRSNISQNLIDRLVKGEKVKMSEREMKDQSKRRYENLPDVIKRKEEQQKHSTKLNDYRQRQEKMKQLDEFWRQKNKSFVQN